VTDQGRDDFLNEAQDIIEAFARNLLSIDAAHKRGVSQPELINEAFREIHTLKGLSSLFGAKALSGLTHKLEDLLDGLRLGRIEISAPVLDVLFSAVDVGHQLLANPDSDQDAELQAKANRVIDAVQSLSTVSPKEEQADNNIDPAILGVLTEYEEHRLRANIDAGQRLFRVRVQFDLMTIDSELSALKDSARQLGEVITYLPTGEATAPDVLELDLVLASSQPLSAVTSLLGSENAVVHEIPIDRGAMVSIAAPPRSVATGAPHSVAGSSFVIPSNKPVVGMSELPRKSSHMAAAQINEQRLARRAVRVDIYKLDRLMNVVGELAILKSNLYGNAELVRSEHNRQLGGELHRLHRVLERRLEDLQNGILEMRMVPLGQIFDRLARGVRQISRDLGKEVRLVVTGAETEIDKLIVEELGDPLLHMLRNAIDHGIEEAPEREKARKSSAGTIALNAYQKGSHVLIEVEDDGRGVNEEKLIARAVSSGAIDEAMAGNLSREELLGLMFLPGLSTRENVSEVSGRGVGMDVVKTSIARLGGVIDIQSERGIGTKMTLTLPVTLAIFRALLVNVDRQQFAVPLSAISEVNLLDQGTREIDGREVTSLRGATLPLCRLRTFFSLTEERNAQKEFVVVAQVGERRLGLVVDSIAGQQDIVIKTLGASLARVRGFSGATELGNQRVGLVLDVAGILEEMLSPGDTLRKVAHG
jgi:two-component system, chemotaxis family, sensor kinase CheA